MSALTIPAWHLKPGGAAPLGAGNVSRPHGSSPCVATAMRGASRDTPTGLYSSQLEDIALAQSVRARSQPCRHARALRRPRQWLELRTTLRALYSEGVARSWGRRLAERLFHQLQRDHVFGRINAQRAQVEEQVIQPVRGEREVVVRCEFEQILVVTGGTRHGE